LLHLYGVSADKQTTGINRRAGRIVIAQSQKKGAAA
jgi:hypothetical protein